jgi:membrane protease YdiL (CAAX protease family)
VDTSTDTPAGETVANAYAEEFVPAAQPAQTGWGARPFGPDNPPWGVGAAVLVWLASVGLLLIVPTLAGAAYLIARINHFSAGNVAETILADPGFILISVAAVIPAHLLTFGLIWWVVTGYGKRSFRELMGWRWSNRLGALEFFACAGVVLVLLVCNYQIARHFPGGDTDLEKIILSSMAARYIVVVLATLSAPLVEESIYRGMLYPALQRALGAVWAVLIVAALFALVHVYQYRANIGVIMAISLLSLTLTLVRAWTGRLLPCVIIHFLFNGVTSVLIVLEPHLKNLSPPPPPAPTGLLLSTAVHLIGLLHL